MKYAIISIVTVILILVTIIIFTTEKIESVDAEQPVETSVEATADVESEEEESLSLPEASSSSVKPKSAKPSSAANKQNNKKAATIKTVKKAYAYINNVPMIIQTGTENGLRSMPAGCEPTSATMVLNYYGYNINKNQFADMIPMQTTVLNDYGPHPNECFVGSPYSTGFGVYAKPVVTAMDKVIDKQKHEVKNITGKSEKEILQYIKSGTPVVIWGTINMAAPNPGKYKWTIRSTGEKFTWITGLHCVVLTGYGDEYVWVNDPLLGKVTYLRSVFFKRYKQLGYQAIVIEEKTASSKSSASQSRSSASTSGSISSSGSGISDNMKSSISSDISTNTAVSSGSSINDLASSRIAGDAQE